MTTPTQTENKTGFSHMIPQAHVARMGQVAFDWQPTDDMCAALARHLDAQSVARVRFKGVLEMRSKGDIHLRGDLGASVTQNCVVTLRPIRTRIDERITRQFVADFDHSATEYQLQGDGDEDIEPLQDPLDIGAIAAEAMALALPPFPRSEDASLAQSQFTAPGIAPLRDADLKPFAALAALRTKSAQDESEES